MGAGDTAWRINRAIRRYGVFGALRQAVHRVRRVPALRRSARLEAEFDRRYGVDTSGIVHLATHAVTGKSRSFAVSYQGISPGRFREVVGALPIAYEQFTFVDLGSGKGRALVLAAELPFACILGVEFSHELHEVARRQRRAPPGTRRPARGAERIEPVWLDAAQFEFPAAPLVVLFFNPFYGACADAGAGEPPGVGGGRAARGAPLLRGRRALPRCRVGRRVRRRPP